MKTSALLFAVWMLVVLPSPVRAEGCESSDECKLGRVCRAARCVDVLACTRDIDCSGDDLCVADRCVAAERASVAPASPPASRSTNAPAPGSLVRSDRSGLAADFGAGIGPGLLFWPGERVLGTFNGDIFVGLGGRLSGDVALMAMIDSQLVHYFSDYGFGTAVGIAPGVGLRFGLGERVRMSIGIAPRIWTNGAKVTPTLLTAFSFALGDSGLQFRLSPKFGFDVANADVPMTGTVTFGIGYAL